jgi:hypothetical protein
MRIERARPDILGFGRFSSREFLGLSLVRKCFGRPCVRSLSRSQFKRDVPRAFGLASHDETLSRLRRRLAVGDKPKLLRILHIAQRDLRDLNRRRPDSFRAASDPGHPPANHADWWSMARAGPIIFLSPSPSWRGSDSIRVLLFFVPPDRSAAVAVVAIAGDQGLSSAPVCRISHVVARSKRARRNVALYFWLRGHVLSTE